MPPPAPDPAASARDYAIVTVAQCALAFALNFMFVFLPFYIQSISPLGEAATLAWTGVIVGAASAMATLGSGFWGRLTDRFSPKALFERGLLSHALLVGVMGFVTDLRLLLLLQLVRGFLGGISTIGLLIVAAISREDQVARRMGTYQSALTLGQILAPPVGAMAAAALGYRGAFLASSGMLFAICAFTWLGLSPLPPRPRPGPAIPLPRRGLWFTWGVAFAGTIQIVFLPSILPALLREYGVPPAEQVVTAGSMVFAYGASAAAGAYGFGRLAGRHPVRELLLVAALGAAGCQLLLALAAGPVSLTLLRMLQTACAAGLFPLILAQAATASGGTIGFLNAARFAGNAAGPILATLLLAHAGLTALCAVLAGGLALVALGAHRMNGGRPSRG